MQETGAKRASFADVLRNRDFLALWLGQVISRIGDSFTYLALMITALSILPATTMMEEPEKGERPPSQCDARPPVEHLMEV